jgi:hypothetical protein
MLIVDTKLFIYWCGRTFVDPSSGAGGRSVVPCAIASSVSWCVVCLRAWWSMVVWALDHYWVFLLKKGGPHGGLPAVSLSLLIFLSVSSSAYPQKGGAVDEVFPSMGFVSLGVLDFIVPEAFGDWGEFSLGDMEAHFFPCFKHF